MSEYWKSTPRYWCKFCSTYVRDTALERSNHEGTTKHQNAIKRSLRELHRGHEREERDKERARREIDRLNGVVSGEHGSESAHGGVWQQKGQIQHQDASAAERQRHLEQLADLGVNIPTQLRGAMAMAGEWTITSTRVIDHCGEEREGTKAAEDEALVGARATGIRKREREQTEEERQAEDAINGLLKTKKVRRWGRDAGKDDELDALLDGSLRRATKSEESGIPDVKRQECPDHAPSTAGRGNITSEADPQVKKEEDEGVYALAPEAAAKGMEAANLETTRDPDHVAIMFKKRKPKNRRYK